MAVEDRVAFALMFLSDNKLHEYLKKLTQKVIEDGDLAGFLVTGCDSNMFCTFFKYVMLTTCSLIYNVLSRFRCKYGKYTVIE